MIKSIRLLMVLTLPLISHALHYTEVKLVASVSSLGAPNTDSRLINPWGLTFNRDGDFVVADNNATTVLATSYEPNGTTRAFNIASTDGFNPTGLEANPSERHFIFGTGPSGPAKLLFATESGLILAYASDVNTSNALVVYDGSRDNNQPATPVYKGLALGQSAGQWYIFAADFHNNKIDVINTNFNVVNSFTDPSGIPAGYAPFNIRNFDGLLYVTFAKQLGPDNHDDQAGAGNGFVDIFGTDGTFIKRLIPYTASTGPLNSPWGLAIAPQGFGEFSQALLVGNFGDGLINAFNPSSGTFLGTLTDASSTNISIPGLWSLKFQGVHKDDHDGARQDEGPDHQLPILIFTSGPLGETGGLVGKILPNH